MRWLRAFQIVIMCTTTYFLIEAIERPQFRQERSESPQSNYVQIALAPEEYRIEDGIPSPKIVRPFRVGKKIRFGLVVTNISSSEIKSTSGHPFGQNRPELVKDGEVITYREDVEKVLEALQDTKTIRLSRRTTRVTNIMLEPYETVIAEYMDLSQWYKPLKPGHYQLQLRHRLEMDQEPWISCSPIVFDVIL